jgi:hypothetical protein
MLEAYSFDFTSKNNDPIISNDHYLKNNNNNYNSYNNSYNSNSSNNTFTNPYNTNDDKYVNISTNYGNDSRFASISSEPIESVKDEPTSHNNTQGNNFLNYLGNVITTTKDIASTIKDKATEYELGTKIQETGSKTFEVLKYTSAFVYEKGTDIVVSSTLIHSKAMP